MAPLRQPRSLRKSLVEALDLEHSGPLVQWTLRAVRSNAGRALGRGLRRLPLLLGGYVLFVAVNALHGLVRGFGDEVAPFGPFNTAEFDRVLFFGGVPSVWLQDLLGTSGTLSLSAYLVWQTLFWLPILLIGLVLLVHGVRAFTRLLAFHGAVIFSADLIYLVAATKPPWMDVDAARLIAVHQPTVGVLDNNQLAALPSLHVAVPFLYALWFLRHPNRYMHRTGIALCGWTAAIAWSIVYTGEHYVFDVITGLAWTIMVYVALERLGVIRPASQREPDAAPDSGRPGLQPAPAAGERAA